MKRLGRILACILLMLLTAALHAQTTNVFGTGVQNGSGFILGSGNWCFGSTCLSVSNGSFSGTVTPGVQTVTITDASSNVLLTVPYVQIQGVQFNWKTYIVPPNVRVSGAGTPYLPCWVGAYYLNTTTSTQSYCASYSGQLQWSAQQSVASTGLSAGWGVPTFACQSPCLFLALDTSIMYMNLGSQGLGSSTWVEEPAGNQNLINVVSPGFGAKCDGSTDDLAAFNAAYAALSIRL